MLASRPVIRLASGDPNFRASDSLLRPGRKQVNRAPRSSGTFDRMWGWLREERSQLNEWATLSDFGGLAVKAA